MVVIVPPQAYIKTKDSVYERYVFAGKDFKAGDLIEVCPVVEFNISENTKDFPKRLEKSIFKWRYLTSNHMLDKYCLALGYAGLYADTLHGNHNVDCKVDEDKAIIAFFARVDLPKGTNLVIDGNLRVKVANMLKAAASTS